jgi:hypothetical protein
MSLPEVESPNTAAAGTIECNSGVSAATVPSARTRTPIKNIGDHTNKKVQANFQ